MPDNPITAEPGKLRRRWFQFRLRTMLVAVVLLGTWLGWQATVARGRLAVRHRLEAAGWLFYSKQRILSDPNLRFRADGDSEAVSWFGRLLGDETVRVVVSPSESPSPADIELLRSKFIEPFILTPSCQLIIDPPAKQSAN